MKAIQVLAVGGPEQLILTELPTPICLPGQALVEILVAGVNYIDIYFRIGRYPAELPFTPGKEGVGIIRELSAGAPEGLKVGDRVGWAMATNSYAEFAVIPAAELIPLPAALADETALALLLQGMTTHYLCHDSYKVKPEDIVVVHAAAGGVGLLLTQYATSLGAKVMATASTAAKRELALAAGATRAVSYLDFQSVVQEMSSGLGAHVVYDGVGVDTFQASLASLRRRGTLVVYGAASGPVPPLELIAIGKGSILLTRPSLGDFIATREELLWRANEVFAAHLSGNMDVRIGGRYSLDQASQAHIDLESRITTGKLIINLTKN